jgi:hypothetical protein
MQTDSKSEADAFGERVEDVAGWDIHVFLRRDIEDNYELTARVLLDHPYWGGQGEPPENHTSIRLSLLKNEVIASVDSLSGRGWEENYEPPCLPKNHVMLGRDARSQPGYVGILAMAPHMVIFQCQERLTLQLPDAVGVAVQKLLEKCLPLM